MQNENTALQSELGTLRPRLSELEQQLTIAQREQVAAERRATTAETARDRAQQGTQAAAVSVTQANARADAANTAMQQAIQERASAIEEKDRAIAAEQAAKGEVQVARGEARIARREATEAQQQLMEAAHLSEIKKGEVETRNTTIRDLQTAIQGLQSNETKSTEQHRAALAEQTQARETLQQQFDTKTRDFNLLAEKMKELQQNLAQKTAALATAEQTAQARATIQIQEAQQNAKREIAQIQHSLDEITAVKDTLSTQLAEAKEQIKALQLQNFGERHTIMRKALNATLISTTVPPRPPNMATTKIYSELDELDNIGTPPPPAPTTIEPLSTPLQTARVLSQIPGASPPPRTPGSAHRPTPRTQQRVENRRPG
jgi:chromosome segregation ATPase